MSPLGFEIKRVDCICIQCIMIQVACDCLLFEIDTQLILLGFNNTSTLVGHFVLSPRERETRDRRNSRGDESEGQGRKRKMNENEETEEIKKILLYFYLLQG